jgi:hypothetical protein
VAVFTRASWSCGISQNFLKGAFKESQARKLFLSLGKAARAFYGPEYAAVKKKPGCGVATYPPEFLDSELELCPQLDHSGRNIRVGSRSQNAGRRLLLIENLTKCAV